MNQNPQARHSPQQGMSGQNIENIHRDANQRERYSVHYSNIQWDQAEHDNKPHHRQHCHGNYSRNSQATGTVKNSQKQRDNN